MTRFIQLAWRNMWRNWRRTVIATIAIVLGLILLIFMDALMKGSDQAIFGNAVRLYGGNIQVHAPGFRDKASRLPLIPLDDGDTVVEIVRAQPEVAAVSKRINTGGMVSSREGSYPVSITAIEPESEAPVSLVAENITQGRFLNSDGCLDMPNNGTVKINGRDVTRFNANQRADLRREVIGFIFQFFALIPVLSAYENVELPLLLNGVAPKERTTTPA